MTELNHRITLAQRPVGAVGPECFATDDVPVPEPGPGEALVEVGWLSIDPTIRGWMAQDTYLPAIEIGAPIRSGGLGTVDPLQRRCAPGRCDGVRDDRLAAVRGGGRRRHGGARRRRARGGPERVRRHRPDGLLRSARRGPPGRGRDRPGVGRRRSDGLGRRPDRPDQGLPGGRHRRLRREVRLADRRARVRRGHQLPDRRRARRRSARPAPTASTSSSTTSAATSSRRPWPTWACGAGW